MRYRLPPNNCTPLHETYSSPTAMNARFIVFAILLISYILAGCGSGTSPASSGDAGTPTEAADKLMEVIETGDLNRMTEVLHDSTTDRSNTAFPFWSSAAFPSYLGPMMERHLSYELEAPIVEGDTARIPARVTYPNWEVLHFFFGDAFTKTLVMVADSADPGYFERAQNRLFSLTRKREDEARKVAPGLIAEAAVLKPEDRPEWFHQADSMVAGYPEQIHEMIGDEPMPTARWEGHIIAVRAGSWKPFSIEEAP